MSYNKKDLKRDMIKIENMKKELEEQQERLNNKIYNENNNDNCNLRLQRDLEVFTAKCTLYKELVERLNYNYNTFIKNKKID